MVQAGDHMTNERLECQDPDSRQSLAQIANIGRSECALLDKAPCWRIRASSARPSCRSWNQLALGSHHIFRARAAASCSALLRCPASEANAALLIPRTTSKSASRRLERIYIL